MTAPRKDTLRRGWCPSTLRPMQTGDGWLVRLHPPGNALSPHQLGRIAALAQEHGNGLIEISARGNLQLRGIREESHATLVAALLAAKMVDETEAGGPQRLTLTSPFAGHDPGDMIDAAALASAIEGGCRAIAGLPAKLTVVVDGGGRLPLDGFAADLRVVALAPGAVAIGLPQVGWFGPVAPSRVPETVSALLRDFAAAHRAAPETLRRMRDLPPPGLSVLLSSIGLPATAAPPQRPAPVRAGITALAPHRFAAVTGLPFGRSDAATLARLARTAAAGGAEQIRISPWRGLAFLGLDRGAAETLLATAAELGLVTRDDDPRLSVQACAGAPACLRGETPAGRDAALLAEAAAPLLAAGIGLHVSGCIKACAHPGAAALTLVGRDGRYDVVLGGTTRDKPAERLDLSQIVQRLQRGQDLFARLTTGRASGSEV